MSHSIPATRQRPHESVGSTAYSWPGYLRAQARIWWRSPLAYVAVGAAVFTVVTCGLQLAAGSPDWDSARAYLNLWVVAGGPSFAALTVGMMSGIESRQSAGGILQRGVPGRMILSGRFAVAFTWTCINHIVAITVWLALSVVTTQGLPLGSALTWALGFGGTTVIGYAWYVALLVLISLVAPVAGTALTALATIVIGVQFVETSGWQALPPAWLLRGPLDAIGTHANGTGLDGASLPSGALPLIASLALAALIIAGAGSAVYRSLAVVLGRSHRGRGSSLVNAVTARLHGPGGALVQILRGGLVPGLCVATVALTLLLARWRPAEDAAEFFGIVALPLGCAVLPTLWIARLRTGIRAVATRSLVPERLGWRLIVAMDAVVVAMSALVGIGLGAGGYADGAALFRHVLVWCAAGWLLIALASVVNELAGQVAGLAWAIIGTVFGALVGGTVLQDTVGWVFPTAWGSRAEPSEMVVVLALTVLLGVPLSIVAARSVYRVRRH
ncbi:hypothetical protein AXK56_00300 [Tsukamurella pulmonis]|uniref:ABC-2 type transport system permease protein n=1 Tax=Tsukamurella pulmonis TaxID=47312 RepID=A0A1H1AKZ3_9ACTN|nr:ABC transporter permease [Tsukamurella pulmonis]KXO96028.1 hypothetical protein AXK56_00300 [Tsukamurella pulmonis]SDQ40320.1 hypothetical protein SAMN04489765_0273 [Tsukamurella pulmonis]SUP26480.1 ABC-2 family transporter protein [Tsukamurella pulmonis]